MGGGAIVKLMIQKLSALFGDPVTYAESELHRKVRQQAEEDKLAEVKDEKDRKALKEQRKAEVDTFKPKFAPEHQLQMTALLMSPQGQQMTFMSARGMIVANPQSDVEVSAEDYVGVMMRVAANRVTIPVGLFIMFVESMQH